jgi:hypothetical protein
MVNVTAREAVEPADAGPPTMTSIAMTWSQIMSWNTTRMLRQSPEE